jgi:valyl-tRNA synthetase
MSQNIDYSISKRYDAAVVEHRLHKFWREAGVYSFEVEEGSQIYSIDTPPPTVSGDLHLGHVYSYSQTDFLARFWRMRGFNVFYPMGFDDNGLPTERLVERQLGIRSYEVERGMFEDECRRISEEAEIKYERLWKRLGLSIDWRYTYRTIDDLSRRIAQWSFIDLYRKGLVYRQKAPTLWCTECRTAIAQADLSDLTREGQFYTIDFELDDGKSLPIATTRPELLPACVAIFIHPKDQRGLKDRIVRVPLFNQQVPILIDEAVDPEVGTGIVMCCTFGDKVDIEWWYRHGLPLIATFEPDGRMSKAAGEFSGLPVLEAKYQILEDLETAGLLLDKSSIEQSIRVHERCDTPVEYLVTDQWFIKILDYRDDLLEAGDQIEWHPEHMRARYRDWVDNLQWDWCISRQRVYGVPFPVWLCSDCGEVVLAKDDQLPVDPRQQSPDRSCDCGGNSFTADNDVMDTWATSSMTPQIIGRFLDEEGFHNLIYPMSLRPQAHEIIRTWAFYTIVKSHHHFGVVPWRAAAISGWALAPHGWEKISKSRGGGPATPEEMVDRYSADAVRYWAASTGLGKDTIISEEKIQAGAKLVTKLWNVARFSEPFLKDYQPQSKLPSLTPTDRWLLSRIHNTIQLATSAFQDYDYSSAKSITEAYFWHDLADNYLELVKGRLYGRNGAARDGAIYTLYKSLLATIKLLAPILPHVTEEIYLTLYASHEASISLHRSPWPEGDPSWEDELADRFGEALVEAITTVRRYKSERHLPLATEIARLQITADSQTLRDQLHDIVLDLMSATRSKQVEVVDDLDPSLQQVSSVGIKIAMTFDPIQDT